MSELPSKIKFVHLKQADWEIDFYSRPIIESDGKKRWELLITTTKTTKNQETFKWEKRCPANSVNSLWLSDAFQEALLEAKKQGWHSPSRIRCWRSAMRTMVKKAAAKLDLEVIESRRTYSLLEWIADREKNFYPYEDGYMAGPIANPPASILNEPIPLPEEIRGDAWNLTSLPLSSLLEANEWPISFKGLFPIEIKDNEGIEIPGLRLFSKNRSLALAGWLNGLEPVRLLIKGQQLLLESGQEDLWLVTDMDRSVAEKANKDFINVREKAKGLQFIAIQSTPMEERFAGFWMLRDIPEI
tara:strand:+ start:570 stop:1469 length:900 start_codon:yes stop_codon:yes gene_type:complete